MNTDTYEKKQTSLMILVLLGFLLWQIPQIIVPILSSPLPIWLNILATIGALIFAFCYLSYAIRGHRAGKNPLLREQMCDERAIQARGKSFMYAFIAMIFFNALALAYSSLWVVDGEVIARSSLVIGVATVIISSILINRE